jgi:hypothetical protein
MREIEYDPDLGRDRGYSDERIRVVRLRGLDWNGTTEVLARRHGPWWLVGVDYDRFSNRAPPSLGGLIHRPTEFVLRRAALEVRRLVRLHGSDQQRWPA